MAQTKTDAVPVLRFPTGDPINAIVELCRPVQLPTSVYPGYIAFRLVHALRNLPAKDGDHIVQPDSVSCETIGDCKYRVSCKDHNGAEYAINVECVRHADGWTPFHLRPGNSAYDRIRNLHRTLEAIQTAAERLAALNPENNLTAKLIASLAKEARGQ